jgi:hypothetical protein
VDCNVEVTDPVTDENLLDVKPLLQESCGDGDGVEEAEGHGLRGLGVVPRRPHHGKPVAYVVHGGLERQVDDTADGHASGGRSVQLVPRRVRVHANAAARQTDKALDRQVGQLAHVKLLTVQRVRAWDIRYTLLTFSLTHHQKTCLNFKTVKLELLEAL